MAIETHRDRHFSPLASYNRKINKKNRKIVKEGTKLNWRAISTVSIKGPKYWIGDDETYREARLRVMMEEEKRLPL